MSELYRVYGGGTTVDLTGRVAVRLRMRRFRKLGIKASVYLMRDGDWAKTERFSRQAFTDEVRAARGLRA